MILFLISIMMIKMISHFFYQCINLNVFKIFRDDKLCEMRFYIPSIATNDVY